MSCRLRSAGGGVAAAADSGAPPLSPALPLSLLLLLRLPSPDCRRVVEHELGVLSCELLLPARPPLRLPLPRPLLALPPPPLLSLLPLRPLGHQHRAPLSLLALLPRSLRLLPLPAAARLSRLLPSLLLLGRLPSALLSLRAQRTLLPLLLSHAEALRLLRQLMLPPCPVLLFLALQPALEGRGGGGGAAADRGGRRRRRASRGRSSCSLLLAPVLQRAAGAAQRRVSGSRQRLQTPVSPHPPLSATSYAMSAWYCENRRRTASRMSC